MLLFQVLSTSAGVHQWSPMISSSFIPPTLINWDFSVGRTVPSPSIYVLTQSFIKSVWVHGYLFFSLGYNLVLLSSVLLFRLSSLWPMGSPSDWLLCLFLLFPWIFRVLPHCLMPQDTPGTSCSLPVPALGSASLPRRPVGEWHLKATMWEQSVLVAPGVLVRLGSSQDH